ncbi:MAG TPA: acyl-CoA dehydrogenase [Rhodospirillales bacterium]|nr:acyl-CoA dehydrogenase [Rhodospirillales bacterium]
MTDWNALSDEEFRHIVRDFFEREYPPHLRFPATRLRWAQIREWHEKLLARGWVAPAWPREYGGMGLSPAKLLIFIEEQERWGVARGRDMGVQMVGPLLIRYGTEEQKRYWLPKILTCEHIWCQGYSEPEAGSDLASLVTRAVRQGDHFVVDGRKIWSTLADDATHMFMLVRTNPDAPRKQAGISFLLVDMKSPGITVRPITTLSGEAEFCEVLFEGVRVPVTNLVGEIDDGWRMAKALLGFERLFIGSPKLARNALTQLEKLARARGLFADPAFADRYARLALDVADHAALYARFADRVRRGEPLGAEVSLLKIWATETYQAITELMREAAGPDAAVPGFLDYGGERLDVLGTWYFARPTTIYGGSNEIQRNILAKAVLELPG